MIQRRYNETVDFDRNWDEYKNGFGSAYGEYWLGNFVSFKNIVNILYDTTWFDAF